MSYLLLIEGENVYCEFAKILGFQKASIDFNKFKIMLLFYLIVILHEILKTIWKLHIIEVRCV